MPVIHGIPETVHWLRERDLVPVIVTITWRFAAEFLADRYGFAAASGCEMHESDDGLFLGSISSHFDAEDKITFVRDLAATHGVGLGDVLAIGDSTSDIPLFREAGFSIALNATANARREADVELDTRDLRDVIPAIEEFYSR